MKNRLAVCEAFYSIQGEGRTMGTPAYFLRLAGCNLMCGGKGTEKDGLLHDGATWRCDSIEVWMKGQSKTFEQVLEMLGGQTFLENVECYAHLVITGGEPLMQQEAIGAFLEWLYREHGCAPCVEVETNGTVPVTAALHNKVNFFNVSPKLANSGMPFNLRQNDEAINSLTYLQLKQSDLHLIWKFVISSRADFDEVLQDWIVKLDLEPQQIWLMPAADNREDLVRASQLVAEICIENNLRFSSRLHVNIWNQKTGV